MVQLRLPAAPASASSTSSSGSRGGFGSSSTLTIHDADALSSTASAPDVEAVAPTVTRSVSLTNGCQVETPLVDDEPAAAFPGGHEGEHRDAHGAGRADR